MGLFTDEQREAVRKYYPDGNDDELFKCFPPGTTKTQIISLAHYLGVKRKHRYNFNDLTGQLFGRLTVLSIDHKGHEVYWKCVCTCGKERVVAASRLLSGRASSCGCSKYSDDLTGKRFGRLVTVERLFNYQGGGGTSYRCVCDCGNEVVVSRQVLQSGHTTSCGCYHREQVIELVKLANISNGITEYEIDLNRIRNAVEGKPRSNSTTGVTGVSWATRDQKYIANIALKKKKYYLGGFKDFEDAVKARKKAEQLLYGDCLEEIARELEDADDVELTEEEKKFRRKLMELLALMDGK